MKLRSVSALAAGVLMALTGLVVNAPAASAASVSGCSGTKSLSWSFPGGTARTVLSRKCKVKSGSSTYYNQDFVSFTLNDTKCDASGPRIFLRRGSTTLWTKYNNKGCNTTVTGTSWTAYQSATWYVAFNGDKYGLTDYAKMS
ncbi:hypothetical protein [Nonomuraea soli]|uniref:Uncharacterized protein n=1 Tax=Nonomuraea soli TaxID=1032476 RepID=A0A7W0HQC7_9ACTN|nr:hypothetical protein [Nonomuraea soli]MBA2891682.1 hypothetical protein [Nonomuraea soli]